MNRPGQFALWLLITVVLLLACGPFARPASAATVVRPKTAPADPAPHPAPGPTTPSSPQPGPAPKPTPGPTPGPSSPKPPSKPKPTKPSHREPTPGPTPPACKATGGDCTPLEGPSPSDFLDVPAMVTDAITGFLGTLVEQVMKPVREFLADTLLATPDVTRHASVVRMWKATLGLAVGVYVLFVTAGGVTVMGYETVQTRYALKQIAPRIVIGLAAAASSLTVMHRAISLSNALAHAIMATNLSDAGQGMVERVLPFALFGPAGLQVYLLILAVMVVVLVVAVLIGFVVRVAMMALLAVGAPLALACHAHPATDGVARMWWRGLGGCMAIQIAQSLTFVLALKLFFDPGASALGIPYSDKLGTLLAGLALFWVLFKIPGWTMRLLLRGTPMHNLHAPAALRVMQHLALYRLMDAYLPGMSGLRRGGRPPGGPGGGGLGRRPGGPRRPGGGGGGGRPLLAPAGSGLGGGSPRRTGRTNAATDSGSSPATGSPRTSTADAGTAGGNTAVPPSPHSSPAQPGTQGSTGGDRSAQNSSRSPRKGAQAVPSPTAVQRHRQQVLPIRTPRVPGRPPRPVQTWLPITTPRTPRPQAPQPAAPSGPAVRPVGGSRPRSPSRARQLTLPVPAERVRLRPARPVQLWLPMETDRQPRTGRR